MAIFEAHEDTREFEEGGDLLTQKMDGDVSEKDLKQSDQQKKTLYGIEDFGPNELHTFDGRIFQRVGSSNDWEITCPGAPAAVKVGNLSRNADGSLSYSHFNHQTGAVSRTTEFADGSKQVLSGRQVDHYDETGVLVQSKIVPAEGGIAEKLAAIVGLKKLSPAPAGEIRLEGKPNKDLLTDVSRPLDARSTAQRATDAGVKLPENYAIEALQVLPPVPLVQGAEGLLKEQPLRDRARPLDARDATRLFATAFMRTTNPAVRQEAIDCLREQVVNNKDQSAYHILQQIIAIKAATELSEAQKTGDVDAELKALAQLASIEGRSIELADKTLLNEVLADDARALARESSISSYQMVDQAYRHFLQRTQNPSPDVNQRTRQDAIDELRLKNADRLTVTNRDDFSHVVRVFDAVHCMLTIKDSTTEASSMRNAAEMLNRLRVLARRDDNPQAMQFFQKIAATVGGIDKLNELIDSVQAGGLKGADAMKQIKSSNAFNDLDSLLDQWRIDRIAASLRPDAQAKDFEQALADLIVEKSSKNPGADELLLWVAPATSIKRINELLETDNKEPGANQIPPKVEEELDRLIEQMKEGNETARTALLMTLMPGRQSGRYDYLVTGRGFLIDVSLLSPQQSERLQLKVLQSLTTAMENADEVAFANRHNKDFRPRRLITEQEATMMAIGLANARETGREHLHKSLDEAFRLALRGGHNSVTMDGLVAAMEVSRSGSPYLAQLYSEHLNESVVSTHLSSLGRMAVDGDIGAIRILSRLTNHPSHGTEGALIDAARFPENRIKIYETLLETHKLYGDSYGLLKALGGVAGRDTAPPVAVSTLLREEFVRLSSKDRTSQQYKSALDAMTANSANWTSDDCQCFVMHLTEQSALKLKAIVDRIPADVRETMLAALRGKLGSEDLNDKCAAMVALTAVSKWCSPADVEAFSAAVKLLPRERSADVDPSLLAKIHDQSAVTLISFLGSGSKQTQDAAFAELKNNRRNWPALEKQQDDFLEKLTDYVQNRSFDLETNEAAIKLLYRAGISRPLAGIFKDLGIKRPDEELFENARRAIQNYTGEGVDGKHVVEDVLANVIRLNALLPEQRKALTGSPVQLDIRLVIGQLVKGTTDANNPPNNPLFKNVRSLTEDSRYALGISDLERNIADTDNTRALNLKWLCNHTSKQSPGIGAWYTDTFYRTDYNGDFKQNQKQNVRRLNELDELIKTQREDLQQRAQKAMFFEVSYDVGNHFKLLHVNQKDADLHLMEMVKKYGPTVLAKLAPDSFAQVPGAFDRLNIAGLGAQSKPPEPLGSLESALSQLSQIEGTAPNGFRAADADAARKMLFEQIDGVPEILKLQSTSSKLLFHSNTIIEMSLHGSVGTRGEEFVHAARFRASCIENELKSISPYDLAQTTKVMTTMERTLAALKSNPKVDELTVDQLEQRIKALKEIVKLLSPGTSENGAILRTLSTIKDGKFDETSWVKDIAPIIASLAACAAVMALTCGTGSVVIFALGFLGAPLAGKVAHEATVEAMYGLGFRNDRSLYGEIGKEVFDPETHSMRKLTGTEVATIYGKEYAHELAFLIVSMGGAKVIGKLLSPLTQNTIGRVLPVNPGKMRDLARGLARAEEINQGFASKFFTQLADLTVFTVEQNGGEALAHPLAPEALGEWVPLVVSMAIMARHHIKFRPSPNKNTIFYELEPQHHSSAPELLQKQLLFFHNEGYVVKPGMNGTFEVTSPGGEIFKFVPDKALAKELHGFEAPDWVANSRKSNLPAGELGIAPRDSSTPVRANERPLAAKLNDTETGGDRAGRTGRARDVYHPEMPRPTEQQLRDLQARYPELSGKAIGEFEARMDQLQSRWAENYQRELNRLERLASDTATTRAEYESLAKKTRDKLVQESRGSGLTEQAITERLLQLENDPNHALGAARQRLEKIEAEQNAMEQRLDKIANQRTAELLEEINAFANANGLPPIKLVIERTMIGAAGGYDFGSGAIHIPGELLLGRGQGEALKESLFHELIHHAQAREVAALALHQSGGNVARAVEKFAELTGRKVTEEFINDVSKLKDLRTDPVSGQPWGSARIATAMELAEGIKFSKSIAAESNAFTREAQFIASTMDRIATKQGLDHFFEMYNSKEGEALKQRLFPEGVPEQVEQQYRLWSQRRNQSPGSFSPSQACKTLEVALQERLARINERNRQMFEEYAKNPIERDAYAGESRKHSELTEAKQQKPARSAEEELGDAKLAFERESTEPTGVLNPANKRSGVSEGTRKFLAEQKEALEGGEPKDLTSAQLERILKLPAALIDLVVTRIKSGEFKGRAAEELLRTSNDAIDALFSLPKPKLDTIVSGLNRGMLDHSSLTTVLSFDGKQQQSALEVLDRFISDTASTPAVFKRFLDLRNTDQIAIADGLRGKTSEGLKRPVISLEQVALTLTNVAADSAYSYISALREGVISPSQMEAVGKLPLSTQTAIRYLLQAKFLSKESFGKLLECTGAEIETLGNAGLQGRISRETLDKIFGLTGLAREIVVKSVAIELDRPASGLQLRVERTIETAKTLEKYVREDRLSLDTAFALSVSRSPAVMEIMEVLKMQDSLPGDQRISKVTLETLFKMARAGEISPIALASYKAALANGQLTDAALSSILSAKPEVRALVERMLEPLLRKDITKEQRQALGELLRNTDLEAVAVRAARVEGVREIFSEFFLENGFELGAAPASDAHPAVARTRLFMEAMERGDYLEAQRIVEGSGSYKGDVSVIRRPVVLELAELADPLAVKRALSEMLANHNANYGEHTEGQHVRGEVKTPEVVIRLSGGRRFSLHDSTSIEENGQARNTTSEEKAYIESLQKTDAGRALLAKEAIIFFEERLIHANQRSKGTGDVSQGRAQFLLSEEGAAMSNDYLGRPDDFSLALREIDVVGALIESGVPARVVEKLLEGQHLEKRKPYYQWLRRVEAEKLTKEPPERKPEETPKEKAKPEQVEQGKEPFGTPIEKVTPSSGGDKVANKLAQKTDYSSINDKIEQLDSALSGLDPRQRAELIEALKNELENVPPGRLKQAGKALSELSASPELVLRAEVIRRLLKVSGLTEFVPLERMLSPGVPFAMLELLADSLETKCAKRLIDSSNLAYLIKTITDFANEGRPGESFERFVQRKFRRRLRDAGAEQAKLEDAAEEVPAPLKQERKILIEELRVARLEFKAWLEQRLAEQKASPPPVRSGGNQTESLIAACLDDLLDTPVPEFGGKTPRQRGFECARLNNTPLDMAGGDIILFNSTTGEYVFIDATSRPKDYDKLPGLRRQSVLESNNRDFPNLAAQKADIVAKLRARLLGLKNDGSPLDIHSAPPAMKGTLSGDAWDFQKTFADIVAERDPGQQAIKLTRLLEEFRATREELIQYCAGLHSAAEALKPHDPTRAYQLLEYERHTREKGALAFVNRSIQRMEAFQITQSRK